MRHPQPVGQLDPLPLHVLGVRSVWTLVQLHAADRKCHPEGGGGFLKLQQFIHPKGREGRKFWTISLDKWESWLGSPFSSCT